MAKAKPTGKRQPTKQAPSPKRATAKRGNDPLVYPRFAELAAELKAGRLPVEGTARDHPWNWSGLRDPHDAKVPPELVPFIESPSIATLKDVLTAHPRLYWHPLVIHQVAYLVMLTGDPSTWGKLDWRQDDYGGPPREVARVYEVLKELLEAHAKHLVDHQRIKWERLQRKPGQRPPFKNPHPPGDSRDNFIGRGRLADYWKELHADFSARLAAKPERKLGGKVSTKTRERLAKLATDVLGGKHWRWSGLYQAYYTEEPPADYGKWPLGERWGWDLRHLTYRWNVDLRPAIDQLFDRPKQRAVIRQERLSGALACAVLAALLDETPTNIRTAVDNYLRPRRRKAKGRGQQKTTRRPKATR